VVFGDILGVFGHYNEPADLLYHEVHRLDVNESGSLYWGKIKNIGDHALFIDMNDAFSLKANDVAGIKANCIYCFRRASVGGCGRTLYEMVRINIETGTKEHHQCPIIFRNRVGWFVPNLCHLQDK
jgi:Protein of unknown function (DUF295)